MAKKVFNKRMRYDQKKRARRTLDSVSKKEIKEKLEKGLLK